jgi:DNA-binding NtrC family response regulator
MQTILAIDDELGVRESYSITLSDDYRVITAESGERGLEVLEEQHADLVLLDMKMTGMSGMEVLDIISEREPDLPVIIVTGVNSVSNAVEAMKRGATEYLIKPWDVDEIIMLVGRILDEQQKERELRVLREQDRSGFESIVGTSDTLTETIRSARRAMLVDSTVLITGESGTGKDMLARAIHSGGSRAKEAFVPVSCCAIPENLVESELFGHEKGAFTGATEKHVGKAQVADKGTLFLDEIGEMPLEAQSKLLRLLQEGQLYSVGSSKVIEVDVRFICATNRNLVDQIKDREFREDLYYRVNVLPIEMPPLRQRRSDLPELIAHFVAKHRLRTNANASGFAEDALSRMAAHDWPGNVRELENTVERILVHCPDEQMIRANHLDGVLPGAKPTSNSAEGFDELVGLPLQEATDRVERRLIIHALEDCAQVQSRAAERLGTTRRVLKYKMDQLGIDTPEIPEASGE